MNAEKLLSQIEAVYKKLQEEGVEAAGTQELNAGVIVLLSVIVEQQKTIEEIQSKLSEVEKYLKGDCFWDPVVGLENKLVERLEHAEHMLAFDCVTSSTLDDVRVEIVDEAARRAKDELEWQLCDKVEEYRVSELESRINDLEYTVSSLETNVQHIEFGTEA